MFDFHIFVMFEPMSVIYVDDISHFVLLVCIRQIKRLGRVSVCSTIF